MAISDGERGGGGGGDGDGDGGAVTAAAVSAAAALRRGRSVPRERPAYAAHSACAMALREGNGVT